MATVQATNHMTRWIDALNRRDLSVANQIFAEDCIIHITGVPEPLRGVEAWKQLLAGFVAAFPDMRITVEETVLSDTTVAMRWRAQGTHNGPFGPVPATGRPVAFDGLVLDHLSGGKVVERWEQFDQAIILQQLGVA